MLRIRKIGAMNHSKAIKAGWTTRTRRRINYAWWSKWSNVMKVRANHVRRQKMIAQRNIARAKREGWFKFHSRLGAGWSNMRVFGKVRAQGLRTLKIQKARAIQLQRLRAARNAKAKAAALRRLKANRAKAARARAAAAARAKQAAAAAAAKKKAEKKKPPTAKKPAGKKPEDKKPAKPVVKKPEVKAGGKKSGGQQCGCCCQPCAGKAQVESCEIPAQELSQTDFLDNALY